MTLNERQMMHRYIDKLNDINYDPEQSHGLAEDLLCEFLSEVGFKDIAVAFNECNDRVGFLYA